MICRMSILMAGLRWNLPWLVLSWDLPYASIVIVLGSVLFSGKVTWPRTVPVGQSISGVPKHQTNDYRVSSFFCHDIGHKNTIDKCLDLSCLALLHARWNSLWHAVSLLAAVVIFSWWYYRYVLLSYVLMSRGKPTCCGLGICFPLPLLMLPYLNFLNLVEINLWPNRYHFLMIYSRYLCK